MICIVGLLLSFFSTVCMASSHQPKGRGRSRTFVQQNPASLDTVPAPTITTTDVQQTPLAPPTSGRGRSRGRTPKADDEVRSPVQSHTPLAKPSTLGTLGEPIMVRTNYFPISQFPQRGIVHKYDIEIRNKKDLLIAKHQRRSVFSFSLYFDINILLLAPSIILG